MLRWALIFFVLAIVMGVLGFGGFAAGALMEAAKWLVLIFVILTVISMIAGRGPTFPGDPVP